MSMKNINNRENMSIQDVLTLDHHHAFVVSPEKKGRRRGKAADIAGEIIHRKESDSNKENLKPIRLIKKVDSKSLFHSALESLFLGAIKGKVTDPLGALQDLSIIIKFDKNHFRARLEMINIHLSRGNLNSALTACDKALESFPNNPAFVEIKTYINLKLV